MENKLNQYSSNQNAQDSVPFSILFSEEFIPDKIETETQKQKIDDFIKLCQTTVNDDITEEVLIQQIVLNAVNVEFGPTLNENKEMISSLTEAFATDLFIKDEIIKFAKRNINNLKIDPTIIN